MIDFMWWYIKAFFIVLLFIPCALVTFGFVTGIAMAILQMAQELWQPVSRQDRCAFCPRPRVRGSVSCEKCGKS